MVCNINMHLHCFAAVLSRYWSPIFITIVIITSSSNSSRSSCGSDEASLRNVIHLDCTLRPLPSAASVSRYLSQIRHVSRVHSRCPLRNLPSTSWFFNAHEVKNCLCRFTEWSIDDKNIDLRIKNIKKKTCFFPFNKKTWKNIPKNISRKFTVNIQCGQCCPVSDY